MRILVLNCYSRNALAVINGLDPSYTVYGSDTQRRFRLVNPDGWFRSARLAGVVRLPSPAAQPGDFQEQLVAECQRLAIDAVIATGTNATMHLARHKSAIEARCKAKMLVEDDAKMQRLVDKWNTVEVCREAGVPMPPTEQLRSVEQAATAAATMGYPVVLKPRDAYASKGVEIVSDGAALERLVSGAPATFLPAAGSEPHYVIQKHVTGALHDVTSLSKDGEPQHILTQQRLVAFYDFGGGGIINRTTDEASMRELAERLLRHVKWNGPLLFDFLKDDAGRYWLLECNPKFWGTTQLTVSAGLNMPQRLVELFALGHPPAPPPPYEVGLVFKWIFPDCVAAWVQRPRTPGAILRRFLDTWRVYPGTRTLWNVNLADMPHLLGIVLNRI